jgi:hypothetical protein
MTRVVALHFQGSAKMAMPYALRGHMHTVAAVTWALQMARRAKNNLFRAGASRAGCSTRAACPRIGRQVGQPAPNRPTP